MPLGGIGCSECSDAPSPVEKQSTVVPDEGAGGGPDTESPGHAAADRTRSSVRCEPGKDGVILSAAGVAGHVELKVAFGDQREGTAPIPFRQTDNGLEVTKYDATSKRSFRLSSDRERPLFRFEVRSEHVSRTEAGAEWVDLRLSEANLPQVLGRDMTVHHVEAGRTYMTDRWTPLEVSTRTEPGRVTILRREGFPSASTSLDSSGLRIRLELDHPANHPFRPYQRCAEGYEAGMRRINLDASVHEPGEVTTHSIEIWLGDRVPVRVQRLPRGFASAMVFTSHADQSKVATTRALLFGHSDPSHERYGTRGMIPRGLRFTLTAWADGGTFTDMRDQRFRDILDRAAEAGVEVCPHSTSSRSETRDEVARLLAKFDKYSPATWIDHQPESNCEALNNAIGVADDDRRYHILDLLAEHGYRYLWTIPDLLVPGGQNLLGSSKPDYRSTLLYRNTQVRLPGWNPWLFRTVWRFVDFGKFKRFYSNVALERLVSERGIQIAHVYLDTYQSRGKLAGRSLLVRDGDHFALGDEADAIFSRMAELQQQGSLWVTSMRELGDHLTGAAEVLIDCRRDGTLEVVGGDSPLRGLTLSVPVVDAEVHVDGEPPVGSKISSNESVFWFDLAPNQTRRVSLRSGGDPVHLCPMPAL